MNSILLDYGAYHRLITWGLAAVGAVLLILGVIRTIFRSGRDWERHQRLRRDAKEGRAKEPRWTRDGWRE